MFLMDKLRPLQLRLILKDIWQYRSQNNKILAETSVNLDCLITTQIVSIWNIKILCYHTSHALFFLRRVTWRKAMILMFKTKRLHRFPLVSPGPGSTSGDPVLSGPDSSMPTFTPEKPVLTASFVSQPCSTSIQVTVWGGNPRICLRERSLLKNQSRIRIWHL